MVRSLSALLLSLSAIVWGWNAGVIVWQAVPPSVEAPNVKTPGSAIRCGPECRVASGGDPGLVEDKGGELA